MTERSHPPKDEITPIDVPVVISAKERAKWKAQRTKLGQNARDFAKRAGMSHGTVSNVESGVQPTLKRSVYVAYVRALYRDLSVEEAETTADREIERTKKLVTRIATATLAFDNDELEQAAQMVELLAKRKR